jgi:SOS-response transcriptional repressor LexA
VSKYEHCIEELAKGNECSMKVFGQSMMPIIKSGSTLTFKAFDKYEVGDIVFCKVKGRYIDAHKVIKADAVKGYLIANNKGFENGWTKTIYGKVIKVGTDVAYIRFTKC